MALFDDFLADPSTKGELSVGEKISGVVDYPGDRDWFRIVLNAGGTYRFNLDGITLTKPTLFLRDASGAELAFNDDVSLDVNAKIIFTATTSGTYFLDAGPFEEDLGSYVLTTTTLGFAGTDGNDTIIGGLGDDAFFGSAGNDSYEGLSGIDTIDYSSLGQRVTLKSQGVIEKAGGLGTDSIAGVERIIGTLGKSNFIDGRVAGPQATSFDINLASDNLTVNGIPGIGSSSFFVQNFTDVRGTRNNDTVVGTRARNVFFGTAGTDSYDGAGGFDTIDYGALGTAVTLKSQGIIEKGALGTDTIIAMERIIGAAGKINVIDGFTGGPQPTSFEIDLDGGLLLVKDIPGIGDQVFFIKNFVDVRGTTNDDVITGSSLPGILGNNTFFGSFGNDSYDGAGGIDTIDYSNLGQRVTLKSQGVIEKAGGFGTDIIAGVERIIGTLGQDNVIDGTVTGPQATSFAINLATNNLTVNGIPGIGSASFFVQNFTDVRGTKNSDTVVGNGARNVFFGTAGADSYDGAGDIDTIDYSNLGQRVTLKSQGVIEKAGGLGTDIIAGVERIIGTLGQSNVIDGTVTGPQATSFDINLATDNLTVNGIPGIGSASFFVQNFTDVRGTKNSDTVVGSDLANSLSGGDGNDTLTGGGGNDILIGGAGNDSYVYDADLALGIDTVNEAGGGIDSLDFSTTTRSIAVNLGLATSQVVNTNLSLALGSATTIENVIGGDLADTLIGNTQANSLSGGDGNDSLTGGGGDDILIGGAGNDSYVYDADLALGIDTVNEAGGGIDSLDFSATTTLSIAVNLGLATSQVVNTNLRFTLGSATTFDNVIGGGLADTLTGNALANSLSGGNGDDTLIGNSGNDNLIGGAGNDSYVFDADLALGADTLNEAGGGIDTLDFSTTTTRSVAVNLGLATSQVVNTNLSLALGSATTFENVIGGGLADTLTGNAASNRLSGGAGADIITGAGGNDIFVYGSLSDSLLANYDVITDYSIGDILDRPGASSVTLNVSTGTAAGLSNAQVGSILNAFSFASSSSVAFSAVGFSGTFVAFNDAIAGFNPDNDAIVHLISYNISPTNTIRIV